MVCKKYPHKTKKEAKRFQRARFPGKPFYVYRCQSCGEIHVSTLPKLGSHVSNELGEMIRSGQSEFIRHVSNRVVEHRVRHKTGTYIVSYHNEQKIVWVLEREEE